MAPNHHRYNARSVSFPARSHPALLRTIEDDLKKLQSSTSFSKSESICYSLASLASLIVKVQHLLSLPLTQQTLSQNHIWVNEFVDISLRLLDLCNDTRSSIQSIREAAQQLQSALRRNLKGIEININDYISSRKQLRKQTINFMKTLKQIFGVLQNLTLQNPDLYLSAVGRAIKEASFITCSIFESLFLFLSVPLAKPKLTRLFSVSKLAIEEQYYATGELEMVDIALTKNAVDKNSKNDVHSKLEAMDVCLQGLQSELDCLFKHLIHTRVTLLNILSH